MGELFRIKICGITSAADARVAAAAGADAIGLNFFAGSPRFVDRQAALSIAEVVPREMAKVGVFVNASSDEIRAAAEAAKLDFVQLHGDEPPEPLRSLTDRPIIKGLRLRDGHAGPVLDYVEQCRRIGVRPAAILVDAFVAGKFGGTGARLDWPAVRKLSQRLDDVPIVLAGGLTADNVAAAIAAARPHGVDVASGVETSPGKKDARLVERFVAEARAALACLRLPTG